MKNFRLFFIFLSHIFLSGALSDINEACAIRLKALDQL